MAVNKGITACSNCKVEKVLASGWMLKSPPNEKLKKNHFRDRWFSMSLVEFCLECKLEDSTTALTLFYYLDDTEANLKGISRYFI